MKTIEEFENVYDNYIFKHEYSKDEIPSGIKYMKGIYDSKEKWAVAFS
jgi:hypothetical protein